MAEVNYGPKIKPYPMVKNPKKQKQWTKFLIFPASWIELTKYKHSVERIGMKGLKPPYIMLVNHAQFLDFKVVAAAMFPRGIVNIAAIDGFTVGPWLLRQAGIIAKRKFYNNAESIKAMLRAIKAKSIMTIYPEAQYTQHGATNELPDAVGKLIKTAKVPVVNFQLQGHYINRPGWSNFKARKPSVPIHAKIKKILTAEQVSSMTVEEIMQVVRKEFYYDDHKYQLEKGILIKDADRAEGMHKLLYKCPDCNKELSMQSRGANIFCSECGGTWELLENGNMGRVKGKEGNPFETVLEWCEWQRAEIRKEIEAGKYSFEDEMEALGLPDGKKFRPLGKVKFIHNMDGFKITGHYNGADFDMVKKPLENYCVQQEFNSAWCNKKDAIGLSTENDTWFLVPTHPSITMKIVLATEELYKHYKAKEAK